MTNQEKLGRLQKQMAKAELPLKETATHLVFGAGNPEAKMFFIGEAPGRQEDLQGLPFIGSAGKQLDALFGSIGLNRNDVYITSILKYRPPNNRPPNVNEIRLHTPFLVKQIQIIRPQMILPLGNFATKFILAGFDVEGMAKVPGISTLRAQVKTVHFKDDNFIVFPLYHPASVLYNSRLKNALLEDFKQIKRLIK